MDNQLRIITAVSVLIFLVMIPLGMVNGVYGFIPDMIFFICLVLFYAWSYNTFRMTAPIFTLLVIGHILHACGIFGWYHISPVPIQWDHITHFIGCMPFAMLFFNWLSQWADAKWFTRKNLLLLIAVFFATIGVGALVELIEFVGFLSLGFGEGGLMFGPGDSVAGLEGNTLMEAVGGGYINTGWDLAFNTIGTLFGIVLMILSKIVVKKKLQKAYYFEPIESFSRKI
ncbi:Uncharacterised protein [uncultured archaeon]|nr:Uncharacterised protein [uncultured archaeon]